MRLAGFSGGIRGAVSWAADGVPLPEMTRRVEAQYFRMEAGIKLVDVQAAGVSASCCGVNLACGRRVVRAVWGRLGKAAVATQCPSSLRSPRMCKAPRCAPQDGAGPLAALLRMCPGPFAALLRMCPSPFAGLPRMCPRPGPSLRSSGCVQVPSLGSPGCARGRALRCAPQDVSRSLRWAPQDVPEAGPFAALPQYYKAKSGAWFQGHGEERGGRAMEPWRCRGGVRWQEDHWTTAISSISTRASLGRRATSTVERAGGVIPSGARYSR
jgi:hypothetical protein